MGRAPQVRPLTVEEAKLRLLEGDADATGIPRSSMRAWVMRHPTQIATAALGVGVAMVLFPKLRRAAIGAGKMAFNGWILWGRLKPPA
jgi:hypothetical protein